MGWVRGKRPEGGARGFIPADRLASSPQASYARGQGNFSREKLDGQAASYPRGWNLFPRAGVACEHGQGPPRLHRKLGPLFYLWGCLALSEAQYREPSLSAQPTVAQAQARMGPAWASPSCAEACDGRLATLAPRDLWLLPVVGLRFSVGDPELERA